MSDQETVEEQPTSPSPSPAVQTPQAPPVFTLNILSMIKKAQLQNGLRHGDYLRYKSYCTRRNRRIRKKLGFLHAKKFKKLDLTPEKVTDVRYLELVLMEAERCWAHAMQLKEESENPRAKFHAKRRLAKGACHAKKLLELCNACSDAKTKLEAESYSAWFSGSSLLEREEWVQAKENFIRAKTVYEELGKVGDLTHQELCRERVNEIEPAIRYCNFSINQDLDPATLRKMMTATEQDGNPALDLLRSKLDLVMTDLRKKEAQSVSEIKWQSQSLPLKNEAVRLAIVSANDLTLELDQAGTQELKMQLFDRIFIHYNDALRTIDADIAAAKKAVGKKKEDDLKVLESLREYVDFMNIVKTMERNLIMANNLINKLDDIEAGKLGPKVRPPNPDEIARLFEFLVKNVDRAIECLGQSEHEKIKSFGAKRFSFQALHSYYVALSYEAAEKYREAIALLSRTETHIKSAISHHEACKEIDVESLSKMKSLAKSAVGRKAIIHARAVSGQESKPASADPIGLLSENPTDYVPAAKLSEFPPKFETISVKPFFSDVATEGLDDLPDLSDRSRPTRAAPKPAEAAASKPSGGFFSSLWGGKK